MESRILRRTLVACGQIACRRSILILLIALALAAWGGYLYAFKLTIVSDRASMVDKGTEWNRRALDYEAQFGQDEYLILVVSTPVGNGTLAPVSTVQHAEMKRILRRWSEELQKRPDLFPEVLFHIDPEEMGNLSLLYLPQSSLSKLAGAVQRAVPSFRQLSGPFRIEQLPELVRAEIRRLGSSTTNPEQARSLLEGTTAVLRAVRSDLEGKRGDEPLLNRLESMLLPSELDAQGYFFDSDGRLATALCTITRRKELRIAVGPAVEFARDALGRVLSEHSGNLQLEAGITGWPALEYDELKASQSDFRRGTLIAAVLIAILFMWGYRDLIRPLLAIFCIALSIGITFIPVYFLIGHLNLLALIFAVIQVSLGVDFGVHVLTYYAHERHAGRGPKEAILRMMEDIGPSIVAGGTTTAAAFFTAVFTEFPGLRELGVIAGTGLLVCLACMLFVYPALLFLLDTAFPGTLLRVPARKSPSRPSPRQIRACVVLVVLAICGFVFGQYSFDLSLLNLQSISGGAYRWQSRLLQVDDRAMFAIATYTGRADLEAARRIFDSRPEVFRRTEALFPDNETSKRRLLRDLHKQLETIQIDPPSGVSPADFKRELARLRQDLRGYSLKSAEARKALDEMIQEVTLLYRTLADLEPSSMDTAVARVQQDTYLALRDGLQQLTSLSDPPPIAIEKLPATLRARFLGKNGQLALVVYPARNTWETANLNEFIEAARRVDPNVFGGLVTFHENGHALIRSFLESALLALIAIPLIILSITRSFRNTIYSVTPLFAAIGLLLGWMKAFHQPWNFANFFALPILIGAGVDYGVHLVHAQNEKQTSDHAVTRAVLYSALTTMIGFGVLTFSEHRGVGSLGLILFVGISLSLVCSLVLLPPLMRRAHGDNDGAP